MIGISEDCSYCRSSLYDVRSYFKVELVSLDKTDYTHYYCDKECMFNHLRGSFDNNGELMLQI